MNSSKFNRMMFCIDEATQLMEEAMEGGICASETVHMHESITKMYQEMSRVLRKDTDRRLSSALRSAQVLSPLAG